MRIALCAALLISAGLANAATAAERQWFLREEAPVCPSYFNMTEAHAAASRGDMQWLAQTGCSLVADGPEVVIVEQTPLPASGPWRVRLRWGNEQAITAYAHRVDIIGYATTASGQRISGLLPYNQVSNLEASRSMNKLLREMNEKKPPAQRDTSIDHLSEAIGEALRRNARGATVTGRASP